jgi:Zn finger protein HypA/HybF involved in hydrogenase expression|tara:strand:+ start:195 stop:323 length:129 start_codon:yes stop_codon:yes gene_type:complete
LKDYQIECEECYETSFVAVEEKPLYCPMCGRRAEPEEVVNSE